MTLHPGRRCDIIEVIFSWKGGGAVAKHLDKFTKPFSHSRIPFLLAEIRANGRGEMVDLVCRFANDAAGELLGLSARELRNLTFTSRFPAGQLEALRPLEHVAFSGSAASFSYTTVLGRALSVTCYQPMYGLAACLLDPARDGDEVPVGQLADHLPIPAAVLELSRSGLRLLTCTPPLSALTGWSRRELLDLAAPDFTRLVEPEDVPDLLQSLLDAVRDGRGAAHECRLRRREGPALWVDVRAELLHTREGVSTFYAVLLDIDHRRQSQLRLRETLDKLHDSQSQLSALFDHLPGGYCLLRRTAEGALVPLRISRGLLALLGEDPDAPAPPPAGGPLTRVFPDDREELAAAAAQARARGISLRRDCRLCRRDGGQVWVRAEALWRPEAAGELIYAACFDITDAKELEGQLQFHRQLCDLLLDRPHLLLLDYDPAADTARIETRDATGHRTFRMAGGYLSSSGETSFIHPDDRRRFAAAVKRAATRPAAEPLEYRGDYDSQGWRWYRVSWLRQLSSRGDVVRLLGRAEDVTAQKALDARFQQLKAGQKKLAPGVLALARLDLTEDRILDAKGLSRHVSRVLFGNTADACLRHLRDNVPEEAERRAFHTCFSREALLSAFRQGQTCQTLDHRFWTDRDRSLWARTEIQLLEDPATGRLTAFCTVRSAQEDHLPAAILEALARDYDAVLTVDAASGCCRLWGRGPDLPPQAAYRALAAQCLRSQAPTPRRTALRRATRLETVLSQLEGRETYRFSCSLDLPGGAGPREVSWRWLDRAAGILLMTIRPVCT